MYGYSETLYTNVNTIVLRGTAQRRESEKERENESESEMNRPKVKKKRQKYHEKENLS